VFESPLALIGLCAAMASLVMAALWALQVRIRDATHVDVAWAYLLGAAAVLYAALGDGARCHRILVAVLAGLWSVKLGTYLVLNRLVGKPEDGRYADLRRRWGAAANRPFFVFFQAQAGFVVVFSLPFVFTALNDHPRLEPLEWAGTAVWLIGLFGTAVADRQLARWRADPAHRGKTARTGLWNYSRHPNYFFEWVTWCGFALVALAAPWGWIGFVTPAFLLLLLFRVTGIPATEGQALRSRGEDYARYQREVSVFVPWFRRRPTG
jgi:steroid 5-alpha reductase family enzyme